MLYQFDCFFRCFFSLFFIFFAVGDASVVLMLLTDSKAFEGCGVNLESTIDAHKIVSAIDAGLSRSERYNSYNPLRLLFTFSPISYFCR